MNLDINRFYTANCIDFMAEMPPDFVDLTVTSPPYDSMRDYKGYEFDYPAIIKGLWHTTKPGGVVVWVVADQVKDSNESGTSFKQALAFKDAGFNLFDTMIYLKSPRGAFGNAVTYWDVFEYMFVFSKGAPKTINLIKDRENIKAESSRTITHRQKDGLMRRQNHTGYEKYGRRSNVWYYGVGLHHTTTDLYAHQHPAIFPEKLAYDHILSWSNEGDLVFDPMSGSGTTCKAARCAGRQYIGVDISAEYTAIAQQRLDSILI